MEGKGVGAFDAFCPQALPFLIFPLLRGKTKSLEMAVESFRLTDIREGVAGLLDQKRLEQMVLQAIQRLEEEGAIQREPKTPLYLILPNTWKDSYLPALRNLSIPPDYPVIIVLPGEQYNDYYIKMLRDVFPGSSIQKREQAVLNRPDDFLTVFPFPDRSLIAKTALCLADTFETHWITQCFTLGQKIQMLRDGLEPLSGKEPKAYREKTEEYIRILSDFGIEMTDHILFSQISLDDAPAFLKQPKKQIKSKETARQIITERDLDDYQTEKVLILHKGDRITLLAKERASELGIEIRQV